ncbi:uncharacterized protein Triagg1_2592 [Trichoderma aggressivum f. europaeum]|uniref:Uncharacterized protein n=1 Tax=Trichoderma aggressivum f. europaeum TaxID=173218 RepID=A0AAE1M2T4_9HYPO|nr:hypothetical protein Triagg1_2592 [Trichoderma aggressivum f. europaeum]
MSKSDMNDLPQEVVLENACLFQPGADATAQTDARPSLMGSILEVKPSKRKSPMVEGAYYSEAIALLRSLPKATHLVWSDLEFDLIESTTSRRSKSALYQKLEKACAEEDMDWKEFDFIKTACQHRPKMIEVGDAAVLLYKLMGVRGRDQPFQTTEYLYSEGLTKDEESAGSIFLFLGLLKFVQGFMCEDPSFWYTKLRSKCRQMENLLEKNRGAPKMRRFMELWDKTAGNGNEDDCDEIGDKAESSSQKRCRIKTEGSK